MALFKRVNKNGTDPSEEIVGSDENYEDVPSWTTAEDLGRIVDYFTSVDTGRLNQVQLGLVTREDFLVDVREFLDMQGVTGVRAEKAIDAFKKYIWGYHILDEAIADPEISDIRVIDEEHVRVKRLGKREYYPKHFASRKEYEAFVNYVAVKNKVNLSNLNAIQTFTDKTTSPNFIMRFTVATQFLNTNERSMVHIRKISKIKPTPEQLINKAGMMSEKTWEYLRDKAKNGSGMLFTGKGGSGKTTLMNLLLEEIPEDRSCLVIQENEELFTESHPEMVFWHVVENKGEGKIEYALKDLAKAGLLIDLDYFVIGEIKGGEALYFLNAAYTGHKCWASVHGINSKEAMDKLADYVLYDSNYKKEDALRMLRAVNTVVYMEDYQVREVSEITGWDSEKKELIYETVPIEVPDRSKGKAMLSKGGGGE